MRIIVLYGKNTFQIKQYTRDVAEKLREIHGDIEQFSYDGEQAALSDVLDELRSYGLIQQHKLVIVDNADQFLAADDRRRPAMESYAKAPVDNATLVMRADTWRAGNLDKLIRKIGLIHKVEPPDENTAIAWCMQWCNEQYQVAMEHAAAQRLVEQIGADLGRLDVELAKLSVSISNSQTITREHVIELVGMSREEKVWEIQSAIASGNPATALEKLRELMVVSRHPEQLVSWAICDLMRKVHAAAQLVREGVQPYAVSRQLKLFGDSQRLIMAAAQRCEPATLGRLLQAAVQTDANSKSGVGDSVRSLEVLTVQIADVIGGRRSVAAAR